MKKVIAFLLSAVLLLTSVFTATMITAMAEETETYSSVVIPTFGDATFTNGAALPSTVLTAEKGGLSSNVSAALNSSQLPFGTLFRIMGGNTTSWPNITISHDSITGGEGVLFYIENNTSVPFFPGLYVIGAKGNYNVYANGTSWYRLGLEDEEWVETELAASGYGAPVPAGFKGYVFIPNNKTALSLSGQKGTTFTGDTLSGVKFEFVTSAVNTYNSYIPAGESIVISAPAAVNDLVGGYPSLNGVTIGGKNYNWFAPVEDTIVELPHYTDAEGNEINLYHTMETVPSSVVKSGQSYNEKDYKGTVTIEKNTSKLPLTNLFGIAPAQHAYASRINFEPVAGGKGALFYVEVPTFDAYEYYYKVATEFDPGTEVTDELLGSNYVKNTETNFRFGINIVVQKPDGSEYYAQQYGRSRPIYTIAESDTEWKLQAIGNSGVSLANGFKGYVYVPFSSLDDDLKQETDTIKDDDTVVGVQFTGLTNQAGGWGLLNGRPNPFYGYVPEGQKLITSAPLIVKGEVDKNTDVTNTSSANQLGVLHYEVALPSDEKVVIGGEAYGYFKGALDVEEYYPEGLDLASADTSKVDTVTNSTSSEITVIDGIDALTKADAFSIPLVSSAYGNWSKYTVEYNMVSGTAAPDGFMVYVELPQWGKDHHIYPTIHKSGKEECLQGGANGNTFTYYYLSDGDKAWTAKNVLTSTEAKEQYGSANATYNMILPDGFKGYVYLPTATFRNPVSSWTITALKLSFRNVDSDSGNVLISKLMLVDNFDTSSTLFYGDNCLVDIANGEKIVAADYKAPEKFYGNESLVTPKNDSVMSFVASNDSRLGKTNMQLQTNFAYGDYHSSFTGTLATANNPIIKYPVIDMTCATEGQYTASRLLSINASVDFENYTGFLMYVANKTSGAKSFGISSNLTYEETVDGTDTKTTAYMVQSKNKGGFHFLADGSKEWTVLGEDATYKSIPANTSGWLYVEAKDFYTTYDGSGTVRIVSLNDIQILLYNHTYKVDDTLQFSFPMLVTNFTEKNAGKAYVNGSNIAQNIFTGEFTAPYDYNGDLVTNLLDLVQAKNEANAVDCEAFRTSYFEDYFPKYEFTNSEATFTLGGSSAMLANPDRGYRSELSVFIKNGAYDPLYQRRYYIGESTPESKGEPDGERANYLYFRTYEEAEAWIEAEVERDPEVELIYHSSTSGEMTKKTVPAKDTLVIDHKYYMTASQYHDVGDYYYVYRVFDTAEDAQAFCDGEKNLKGDGGYEAEKVNVELRKEDGTFETKTYYRAVYYYITVFTEMTEAEQKEVYARFLNQRLKKSNAAVDPSSVILTYLYLGDWNGATPDNPNGIVEPLSDEALKSVAYYFETADELNVQTEIRFSYNAYVARNWRFGDVEGGDGTQDFNDEWLAENCANEGTILKHIEQLAPVVAKYKNNILTVSNGFIGYVGEMNPGYQWPSVDYVTVQKAIVEKLCVPNGLFFSTRSPAYKNLIKDAEPDYPYLDYIAHNNDATYGEQTNEGWHSGNYQVGSANGHWEQVTAEAYKTPQGGELFTQEKLNGITPTGKQVLLELAHHRNTSFSYWHCFLEMGDDGSKGLMQGWREEIITPEILEQLGVPYDPAWFDGASERNAYEYIRDHLGYRIVADEVNASVTTAKWNKTPVNSEVTVSMNFKNYGFAAAFNMNAGFAILDANGKVVTTVSASGDSDASKWISLAGDYYTTDRTNTAVNDDIIEYSVNAKLSANLEEGEYKIAFFLKNNAEDYAQLANNVEFINGYNVIGSFSVK